jgi:phosphotransferase system enzyme I (PtsI)
LHPAVFQVISHIIRTANKANVPVTICGEMAGNAKLTRLLLGMGLRQFSMYAANILKIKDIILNSNINEITPLVSKILRTENRERIYELVDKLNEDLDVF